jgi:N-acetylglucosamine-6-phosphate deacetylase
MPLLLSRCRLFDAPPDAEPVDLLLDGGSIARIGDAPASPGGIPTLDAGGRILIPGLIDLHIHGAGGADLLDGSPEGLEEMSRTLARLGTTSFLGTTFLWPATGSAHLRVAAERVGADLGGARMLGLYLEGPFINPERRGGLPREAVLPPSSDALRRVLEQTAGTLRLMTIAPELPEGLRLIEELTENGVVPAFGHSDASYRQTRDGIEAGIRHVTHLFNAMRGLHHREPGPLVAIHEAGDLPVELIGDGVHVDRHVIRWARSLFGPGRLLSITDAMRTAGLPDGRYRYGGRDFESRDGAARYMDGTLIGTSLGLLQVVLRLREFTGCSLAEAVESASRAPARRLGLNKGSIEEGRDADLVLLDPDHSVWATIVGGNVVYRKEEVSGT